MLNPISLSSKTPRFAVPLLFSGQAQKEATINEAHSIIDALLHPSIRGELNVPPSAPTEGECWLVGSEPSDAWFDHAWAIASFQAGTWLFVKPRDGLRLFDEETSETMFYRDGWHRADTPEIITGGNVIDQQAREAIERLVAGLIAAGVLRPR